MQWEIREIIERKFWDFRSAQERSRCNLPHWLVFESLTARAPRIIKRSKILYHRFSLIYCWTWKAYTAGYAALGGSRSGDRPSAAEEGRKDNKINRKKIPQILWRREKWRQCHLANEAGSRESRIPGPVNRWVTNILSSDFLLISWRPWEIERIGYPVERERLSLEKPSAGREGGASSKLTGESSWCLRRAIQQWKLGDFHSVIWLFRRTWPEWVNNERWNFLRNLPIKVSWTRLICWIARENEAICLESIRSDNETIGRPMRIQIESYTTCLD
jgi:hypothetical protein